MSRNGDWIQTYKGIQFWPLDPHPEDVHIGDIVSLSEMKANIVDPRIPTL